MAQASRSSGTTWKRVGIALLVVGLSSGVVIGGPGGIIWMNSKLLMAIFLFCHQLSCSLVLSCTGADVNMLRRDAESVITDAKPHLLYLRPFRSDYTTTKGVLRARLETTEEEQLADVLRPFGELVAIGRPGESLPTPGAARIYTSDEEWRDVVKRQMQATRLVVIRAAVGENVLWELTQAVRT